MTNISPFGLGQGRGDTWSNSKSIYKAAAGHTRDVLAETCESATSKSEPAGRPGRIDPIACSFDSGQDLLVSSLRGFFANATCHIYMPNLH